MGPVYFFLGGGMNQAANVAGDFEGFYVNCSALFGVMVL